VCLSQLQAHPRPDTPSGNYLCRDVDNRRKVCRVVVTRALAPADGDTQLGRPAETLPVFSAGRPLISLHDALWPAPRRRPAHDRDDHSARLEGWRADRAAPPLRDPATRAARRPRLLRIRLSSALDRRVA